VLHVRYSNPEVLVAAHSLLYFASKQAIKFYPYFIGVRCYEYLLRLTQKEKRIPTFWLSFLPPVVFLMVRSYIFFWGGGVSVNFSCL